MTTKIKVKNTIETWKDGNCIKESLEETVAVELKHFDADADEIIILKLKGTELTRHFVLEILSTVRNWIKPIVNFQGAW